MDYFYPPLDVKNIKLVTQLAATHPDYFTNAACPYDEDIKAIFQQTNLLEAVHDLDDQVLSDADILKRINLLAKQLETYGKTATASGNSSDANTFFRLSASLTERIIEMRNKMSNLMEVEDFIDKVIYIMEDVCTPDQRNMVMDKLQTFYKKGDKNVISA